MISFIIPTYNYICVALVGDLQRQAAELKASLGEAFDYEIIVADDGSPDKSTIEANRAINALQGCRLEERPRNVGRAYLCNWLIEAARFNLIVLIDSDAAVCTPDFVARYWHSRSEADVVCGTIRNPQTPCQPGCELRYAYEKKAEKTRAKRDFNASPYLHLSTFNIMLNRRRIGGLRFDTRCKEYGYEDSLFGLTLRERGMTVKHIDNPLIHTGIDTNESFLKKTEASMRTLYGLKGVMQESSGTSRLYKKLCHLHVDGLFRLFFKTMLPLIRRHLLGRHPSVKVFQLYKLGYYALYDKTQQQKEKK